MEIKMWIKKTNDSIAEFLGTKNMKCLKRPIKIGMVNAVIWRCKNRRQWLSNNFKQCELISSTFILLFCRICFKNILFCCLLVFEFNHSRKKNLSTAFLCLPYKPHQQSQINFSVDSPCSAAAKNKQLAYKMLFTRGTRKLCKVRILCHMRIHALLCRKKRDG